MVAINSSSMEPIYSRGDAVIFKKVNANEIIEAGKIIAYKKNETFITHRIVDVAVFDNVYTTKGDKNNKVDDYVVYANDVFGVVIYKLS